MFRMSFTDSSSTVEFVSLKWEKSLACAVKEKDLKGGGEDQHF
jgi:hypothetical protein